MLRTIVHFKNRKRNHIPPAEFPIQPTSRNITPRSTAVLSKIGERMNYAAFEPHHIGMKNYEASVLEASHAKRVIFPFSK